MHDRFFSSSSNRLSLDFEKRISTTSPLRLAVMNTCASKVASQLAHFGFFQYVLTRCTTFSFIGGLGYRFLRLHVHQSYWWLPLCSAAALAVASARVRARASLGPRAPRPRRPACLRGSGAGSSLRPCLFERANSAAFLRSSSLRMASRRSAACFCSSIFLAGFALFQLFLLFAFFRNRFVQPYAAPPACAWPTPALPVSSPVPAVSSPPTPVP